MQIMEIIRKYLVSLLLLLCVAAWQPVSGQFIRTHIHLPAGCEIMRGDLLSRIYPNGKAPDGRSRERYVWLELRAVENLQLLAEFTDPEDPDQPRDIRFSPFTAGISTGVSRTDKKLPIENMLLLNDGSENFATAASMYLGDFVLRQNPRGEFRAVPYARRFSAWIGIPLENRWHTVIHYP